MGTPRKVTALGKTMTVTEWARESGIPAQTIFKRLEAGWDAERAVTATNRTLTGITTSHPVEFRIWKEMRRRCYNAKRPDYHRYGGRGVKVDPRWDSFAVFLADVGPRPSKDHSIERRENDKDYGPDNCFWATDAEQRRNKRTSHKLTHDGVTLCIVDWAERTGIPSKVISHRINEYGWSAEQALTTPVMEAGKYPRTPKTV